MSDRTFKISAPHMTGNDVRNWQREVPRLFAGMDIDYELEADGDWGKDSRDATASLCKASGLLADEEMEHGVTPELRSKLRNRPDEYTTVERKRFGSKELVEYRRQLRRRGHKPGVSRNTFPGSPIPGTRHMPPDHPTAGLAGFPGRDYFAPGGSPCVSPAAGKVVRLSGHDPRNGPPDGPHGPFGWSVYIDADDGKTYFLTHMGSRTVAVGDRVAQGERIGTVGNYDQWGGTDHIHMGIHS